MTNIKTSKVAALAALLGTSTAFAQTNQPDQTDLWNGDVEFGYFQLEGNSEESSVIAKTDAKRVNGQ